MTSHVERLVQQLDGDAGASYDARAELIWLGSAAIPAIIDGLPSLGGFGQLTAIEVFQLMSMPCWNGFALRGALTRPSGMPFDASPSLAQRNK
ncbi:hypothetical protein NJL88_06905 [Streptomyces sp. DK15]|uniref:hypothetical protein n=1 Tax=Streptomyces sp. DK15 TaxID=2957499 RepID=UPI0029B27013|nr:hypothetical protein [Streptomyces sp. DK15]MDX2389795.1 hypothetical protein [Streptomyces sp. DK15]